MENSTLLECKYCKKPFQPTNKRQRFCSAKHRAAAAYHPTKQLNDKKRLERHPAILEQRRAMSMGFDGRVGGPKNVQGIPGKPVKKEPAK